MLVFRIYPERKVPAILKNREPVPAPYPFDGWGEYPLSEKDALSLLSQGEIIFWGWNRVAKEHGKYILSIFRFNVPDKEVSFESAEAALMALKKTSRTTYSEFQCECLGGIDAEKFDK